MRSVHVHVHVLVLGLSLLAAGCPAHTVSAPRLEPTPTTTRERSIPSLSSDLDALTHDCLGELPEGYDDADLLLSLERAFDERDPRCWSAREIVLAGHYLDQNDPELLSRADLHARQAEMRSTRQGHDDLGALARLMRARIAMAAGDAAGTIHHLERAATAAGLWAAVGLAPEALDAIYLRLFVEALARWEQEGLPADYGRAAAAATRLHGREALRALLAAGATPAQLAEVAENESARERLEDLRSLTERSRLAWGTEVRKLAPGRAEEAEALEQAGPGWMAGAPLLLDWLPGELEALDDAATAVLAGPEVLLVYVSGEEHGGLLVMTEESRTAHTLAGGDELEGAIEACWAAWPVAEDPPAPELPEACQRLATELLHPAAEVLESARQVLIVGHGPVHGAPFERLLPGHRVYRVPSLLGLAGIRLRAWQGRPLPHPAARDLLPRLEGRTGVPDTLGRTRLHLSAGENEVEAPVGGRGPRVTWGVPLTVPAAMEAESEGSPSAPPETPENP
ncbi:MAG: hypothetical protein P1V51_14210 [Deltaproteobacteria bacterium]|nr:hypothetical protein [Deltaproteobacteria bacterium]